MAGDGLAEVCALLRAISSLSYFSFSVYGGQSDAL